jgi:hypothetical protein
VKAIVRRVVDRVQRWLRTPAKNAVCACGRSSLQAIDGCHMGCPGCVEYVNRRLSANAALRGGEAVPSNGVVGQRES